LIKIKNWDFPFILFRSHQSNLVLFPPKLEDCRVVDLGCGVGRDVFILSKLVGENGQVIGIDSEKDQVKIFSVF
jgi:ubiquinone/menaquinone biosynthesis C-methylase UbiE